MTTTVATTAPVQQQQVVQQAPAAAMPDFCAELLKRQIEVEKVMFESLRIMRNLPPPEPEGAVTPSAGLVAAVSAPVPASAPSPLTVQRRPPFDPSYAVSLLHRYCAECHTGPRSRGPRGERVQLFAQDGRLNLINTTKRAIMESIATDYMPAREPKVPWNLKQHIQQWAEHH
jgi:hypothetical protein